MRGELGGLRAQLRGGAFAEAVRGAGRGRGVGASDADVPVPTGRTGKR